MNIDINFSIAYWGGNINVTGFHWQPYGHGLWYDTTKETYSQAVDRIKEIIWQKVYSDHPHLVGTELKYTDAENLPVIQVEKSKPKPDIIILKKYENAIKENNQKVIDEILSNYEMNITDAGTD